MVGRPLREACARRRKFEEAQAEAQAAEEVKVKRPAAVAQLTRDWHSPRALLCNALKPCLLTCAAQAKAALEARRALRLQGDELMRAPYRPPPPTRRRPYLQRPRPQQEGWQQQQPGTGAAARPGAEQPRGPREGRGRTRDAHAAGLKDFIALRRAILTGKVRWKWCNTGDSLIVNTGD